jgi:hypothetical protein
MGLAVGRMFVAEYFDASSKADVNTYMIYILIYNRILSTSVNIMKLNVYMVTSKEAMPYKLISALIACCQSSFANCRHFISESKLISWRNLYNRLRLER